MSQGSWDVSLVDTKFSFKPAALLHKADIIQIFCSKRSHPQSCPVSLPQSWSPSFPSSLPSPLFPSVDPALPPGLCPCLPPSHPPIHIHPRLLIAHSDSSDAGQCPWVHCKATEVPLLKALRVYQWTNSGSYFRKKIWKGKCKKRWVRNRED